MKVLKFGGSSVANATAISRTLDIVENAAHDDRVCLVCSAISGCTDTLIAIGKADDPEQLLDTLLQKHINIIKRLFSGSEKAEAIAQCKDTFCEIRTIPPTIEAYGEVLSTQIIARKLATEGFSAKWIDSRDLIRTKDGKVDTQISYAGIRKAAKCGAQILVAPGFIARDENGEVTTLGRGGSDYSAALYAAALKADDLQIWTDVPGIMTANPKTVPAARTIPKISYKAAFDMARYGAKVLYAPTVVPAQKAGIAINIRNTFDPANPGTVISLESSQVAEWKGVSSFATEPGEEEVCLVGEGAIKTKPTARRIVNALVGAGIKPLGDVTSEDGHNFFIGVRAGAVKSAIAAIHREFFEQRALTTLDIYIAGAGAVGTALGQLVEGSRDRIASLKGRTVRVVEISSNHDFAARVLEQAPRGSVFVDCTDSSDIHEFFVPMLEKGINIVTSNLRSVAVPYVKYAAIKTAARENGTFFRYSTTVGNALPVLESIAGEANCSDEITDIEAVVSCTMNHIITGYDGANTESFATLLRKAQNAGLSERDPRTDLGGMDALRKLLILAREAGVALEEDDVDVTPMLPKEFFEGTLEDFYAKLEESEPEFIRKEAELDELDRRQRFVASLHRDPEAPKGFRAEIRMQLYGINSPFYWISGTENVIKISGRYSAPTILRGAGEGARQAAAGILNDILK